MGHVARSMSGWWASKFSIYYRRSPWPNWDECHLRINPSCGRVMGAGMLAPPAV